MRDLSAHEACVLNALGSAATLFSLLPAAHPNDREEFVRAIHAAQNIVLARPATETEQRGRT